MVIKQIHERLAPEISRLNSFIDKAVESSLPMLNSIVNGYMGHRGKQIRPIIVILGAQLLSGKVTDAVLHAGASLEILHNASLIHDDVIDATGMRRGIPTVNAVWNNHIAVLTGDFLVSKSLDETILTESTDVIRLMSRLARVLSEGELHQIFVARDHDFSIKKYFYTVEMKTAILFESCVLMGAAAAGVSEQYSADLVKFVHYMGLCFQIRDDMLDYDLTANTGKPTGNDLREDKVTIPLLHALRVAPKEESDEMKRIIDAGDLTDEQIHTLIDFARRYGGPEYCVSVMNRLYLKASRYLASYPDCEARRTLDRLFTFIIGR